MILEEWKNQKIVILGFGREGQATLRYLKKHLPEAKLAVADKKKLEELGDDEKALLDGVELNFGDDYLESLKKYDLIIKAPGINPRLPGIQEALRAGVKMTSATNLFFALKKGKVVAVTGSKGKSTTSSLIYAVLSEAGLKVDLIGNIGRAALDFLESDSADKVYVFEMSSYQLEDFGGGADYDSRTSSSSGGAEVAVLVSFFPEHLDYHGSVGNYFKAKMRLVENIVPGQVIIWNAGNESLRAYMEQYMDWWTKAQTLKETVAAEEIDKPVSHDIPELIPFNDGELSLVKERTDGGMEAIADKEVIIREDQIKLTGKHNLENILAVYEVAKNFKIPLEVFRKAVREFTPLEHRLELVGEFKEITFYNDAISTTPESTIAAIDALSRKKPISTLIAGGMDRGYDFQNLAEKIVKSGIKNLILLPETGKAIAEEVKKISGATEVNFTFCGDMESCVAEAYIQAEAGTICLLSCASPSYNLFKNFEERGRRFKEAVRKG